MQDQNTDDKPVISLNAVFDENAVLPERTRFLADAALAIFDQKGIGELFQGTGNAWEKETLIAQTLRGMSATGKPYNCLGDIEDSNQFKNWTALRWLEANHFAVQNPEGDKIALTDKTFKGLLAIVLKNTGGDSGTSFLTSENNTGANDLLLPG